MKGTLSGAFLGCWLLTLSGCDREAPTETLRPAAKSEGGKTVAATELPWVERFADGGQTSGLEFVYFSAGSSRFYFPEIMGGGAGLLDFDGDGDLDIFLPQGRLLDPTLDPRELRRTDLPSPQGDRLLENRLIPDGKLRYIDATEQAGIRSSGYSIGVATGDVDNDGHLDIYVTRFGSNTLLRNRGDGTFEAIAGAGGADDERWNSAASFFDYDADGDLDLFLAAYVAFNLNYEKRCKAPTGDTDYCSPSAYRPLVDRLFENVDGHFEDVTQRAGLGGGVGPGLGSVVADFDLDGRLDLYVANDGKANFLWRNEGEGRFRETGLMAGAAFNLDGNPEASMGVAAGDYDKDGDPDLFMTHLLGETNTLYRNNGSGVFMDSTVHLNLAQGSRPLTGFGTVWFDVDNDGWIDLFIANGGVVSNSPGPRTTASYAQVNQLFLNLEGQRFLDVSDHSGDVMKAARISRGVAKGDIDNDGDIDLLVSNNNGPLELLLNTVGQSNAWLRVQLTGIGSNRFGVGARVGLEHEGSIIAWQRLRTDGSYLSANEPVVHFGLGESADPLGVVVIWPNGQGERWAALPANHVHTLTEGTGEAWEVTR